MQNGLTRYMASGVEAIFPHRSSMLKCHFRFSMIYSPSDLQFTQCGICGTILYNEQAKKLIWSFLSSLSDIAVPSFCSVHNRESHSSRIEDKTCFHPLKRSGKSIIKLYFFYQK